MDESYIFHKTDQGAEELGARSSALAPKQRRCLILVDGRKTVRDLSVCFRPGELVPLLKDLVQRGYLEAPPAGVEAIDELAGEIDLVDEVRFLDIRQRAVREISDRLGPQGDVLALEIDRCGSPAALRIALRNAERVLQGFIGADEARDFVRRVGRELMG